MFDVHQYVSDAGWDFSHIEATATLGVSTEDCAVIDQMAGVHDDNWDPPTDAAASEEADAVKASAKWREELLTWCRAQVVGAARKEE